MCDWCNQDPPYCQCVAVDTGSGRAEQALADRAARDFGGDIIALLRHDEREHAAAALLRAVDDALAEHARSYEGALLELSEAEMDARTRALIKSLGKLAEAREAHRRSHGA